MTLQHAEPPRSYVPALGYHRLTAIYDPLIRAWIAASRMRSSVIDALELQPGMRVLELGAGPGRLAIEIKRAHPEVTIEAIDIDRRMVAYAQRNAASAGVEVAFCEADMTCLPARGAYDRVYSTMTFHHLLPDEKQRALDAARRALARGGKFVVADFGRPRGALQWILFSWFQQPLDGIDNTRPHRDGNFERSLHDTFGEVRRTAVRRTIAGTVETFVCAP